MLLANELHLKRRGTFVAIKKDDSSIEMKRLNWQGEALCRITLSPRVRAVVGWGWVNLRPGSEAVMPELMGNYWGDLEEICWQQFPCRFY